MDKIYVAADGQVITEAMINRWTDSYEKGEFPEGEESTGPVLHSRPPHVVEHPGDTSTE